MTADPVETGSAGVRPWIASVAGNLSVKLLALVASIVLARVMGPVGRGEITGAILWPMLIIGVATTVAVRAVTYFGTRSGGPGFRACVTVAIVAAAALLPITLLINWFTLGVHGKPNYLASNIYALTVPLSVLSAVFAGGLLTEGRVGWYWSNEAITAAITAIGVIVLAATGRLSSASYATAAVAAVSIALLVTAVSQRAIGLRRAAGESHLGGAVWRYAIAVTASLVPLQLNTRVDQILVSMAAPMAVLGQYAVAFAWSSILSMVGGGFSAVILAQSARLDTRKPEHAEQLIGYLRRGGSVVCLAGLATCLSAPIAIPLLYGASFRAAVAPAMILSIASIPLYWNMMLHEASRGLGFPSLGWLPESAGVAASLVLLRVLYFRYGMIGAATSSLISYVIVLILLTYQLRRAAPALVASRLLPRVTDFREITRIRLPKRLQKVNVDQAF